VGNCVFSVGVDGAPVIWTHQIGVDIVGIGSTTSSITAWVKVGCNIVTSMQGGYHSVLVAFIGVILRTEITVNKVSITVVIPTC
jgi:hypothetical protein